MMQASTAIPESPQAFHKIAREQEAEHRRELRRLSDLAFTFLDAASGDPVLAEKLLDDFIDLVFEGGVMQTWRYRVLLEGIRAGL